MLSGRLPFVSESEYELLRAQVETAAPSVAQFVGGIPDFVAEAVRRALEKDANLRYPSCGEMATFLREGAAAAGCELRPVSDVLEIKPHTAEGTHFTTVRGFCQRIDGLIQNGNYDTAERVADSALNEFPANPDLATRREKARQAAGQRPPVSRETATPADEPLSPDEISMRQTLLRLVALDATGDLAQALATLHEAMTRNPDRTAYRIAEAYLSSRSQK